MTLAEMKETDIRTVDVDDLVELSSVHTDPGQSKFERILSYIIQIKNPYCFRIGKIAIKTRYANKGKTLEEGLANLLMKTLEIEQ